jgi:hypothetical protein
VTMIHHGKKGVARTRMNLRTATVHRNDKGAVVNDILVPAKKGGRRYLTSDLFVTWARSERLAQQLPQRVARR